MNKRFKKRSIKQAINLVEAGWDAPSACINVAGQVRLGPPTRQEGVRAKQVISCLGGTTFYHGGTAGLSVGDKLLPGGKLGRDPRLNGKKVLGRQDFVFITLSRVFAQTYGPRAGGWLYSVSPHGELSVDIAHIRASKIYADLPVKYRDPIVDQFPHFFEVLSFTCASATILEVLG